VKRAKVAIVVALAVALGAAACSSPSKSSGGGTSNTKINQQNQAALDPTAKGPAPDVPGFKKGGTITVTSESTVETMDPTRDYYVDANEISRLIYRTPTQYDIRKGVPVLVPDLTDLGTVSADKLTWTFKLQSGIKYQDGSVVTSQDLAYAISRSFARDLFPDGPTYQLTNFAGGDTYKGPYGTPSTLCSCVTTPDANTLVIHLKAAFPDLPYFMTFPMFTPIPQAKDTKTKYELNPMTTGPYQYASAYQPGVELKLKKNPFWDPKTDPARHQYADAYDFLWGGNDLKSQQAILNGATQVDQDSVNYGNVDSTLLTQLQGPKASQLITGDSPCTIVVQLDTRKIPLPIRKAIATAYPYDQTYTAAHLNSFVAEKAHTILPPSVPGYTNYPALPGLSGQGTGDPVAAKAMLVAAGKVGFQLSWYYNNTDPVAEQTNTIRTQALEKAGFTVKSLGVTPAELRADTGNYKAPVNMGQSPAGWCSDWPTGGSWFPVLFESSSLASQTSWGMMSDPTLDQQINAVEALPENQQPAKWGALDKQIMGLYVALPRYYSKLASVQGTGIGGGSGDPTMGLPNFANMFVK
jgi:peptide/nickel transport system substrate-binding protein